MGGLRGQGENVLVHSHRCLAAVHHGDHQIGSLRRFAATLHTQLLHGIGGIVGGILTGIFCVPELSWTDYGGLLYTGDPSLLISQILGIVITIVFVAIATAIIAFIVKACFGGSLAVKAADEGQGMDVAQHGESAYPAFDGLD